MPEVLQLIKKDFMIYNSRICTNTLESHTATNGSVSKKDSISIMRL